MQANYITEPAARKLFDKYSPLLTKYEYTLLDLTKPELTEREPGDIRPVSTKKRRRAIIRCLYCNESRKVFPDSIKEVKKGKDSVDDLDKHCTCDQRKQERVSVIDRARDMIIEIKRTHHLDFADTNPYERNDLNYVWKCESCGYRIVGSVIMLNNYSPVEKVFVACTQCAIHNVKQLGLELISPINEHLNRNTGLKWKCNKGHYLNYCVQALCKRYTELVIVNGNEFVCIQCNEGQFSNKLDEFRNERFTTFKSSKFYSRERESDFHKVFNNGVGKLNSTLFDKNAKDIIDKEFSTWIRTL